MANEVYMLKCDIQATNRIFRSAIRQVILLNEKIVNLKTRYQRACAVNRRSFRYTTRLRLAAVEGTRNMYYEFASVKCNEIEELQDRLRELTGEEYDFAEEENNFTDAGSDLSGAEEEEEDGHGETEEDSDSDDDYEPLAC